METTVVLGFRACVYLLYGFARMAISEALRKNGHEDCNGCPATWQVTQQSMTRPTTS